MKPPILPTRIAKWLIDHHWQDELIGDLEEQYRDLTIAHGKRKAQIWYWREIVGLIRPHLLRKRQKLKYNNMTINHIKISYRNLRKNKVYSFINILGLSVGLASVILIGIYVNFETSYDKFFEDSDRIHRVALHRVYPNRTKDFGTSSINISTLLNENYPEVEVATRLHRLFFQNEVEVVVKDSANDREESFVETRFLYADSLFFKVFSYRFLHGDPETALESENSLVITRSTAIKYFGKEDVVGKVVVVGTNKVITGVIEDIPFNSHIHFDVLGSIQSLPFLQNAIDSDNWSSPWVYSYVKFKEGVDVSKWNSKLADLVDKYGRADLTRSLGAGWKEDGHAFEYYLQPLTSIHLYSKTDVEVEPNSSISLIYTLAAIGVVILLISSINFINLSIARSTERAKEVGIRKVLGSFRTMLIHQFLTESVLICVVSAIFSVGILSLIIPYFNELIGTQLDIGDVLNPFNMLLIFLFVFVVGILSGLYPALAISAMKPSRVLKGSFKTSDKGVWLRNVLITFQFLISIIMISGSFVTARQMRFLQNKDLGFDKENLLIINSSFNLGDHYQAFRNELVNIPGVEAIGNASVLPGQFHGSNVFNVKDPGIPSVRVNTSSVDDHFIPAIGYELVEGRAFDPNFNDSLSVVVNESTREAMGVESALGYKIQTGNNPDGSANPEYTIIGVLKDFNFYSLHSEVSPFILFNLPPQANSINSIVRLGGDDLPRMIRSIEEKWNEFSGEAFRYSFMDQELQRQYEADQNTAQLFDIFTFVAIIMSCTGLFGLATYIVNQRSKEMSIRKVLGASILHIIGVFSREFVILIGIAFCLSIPATFFALKAWLQNFAYHTDIGVMAFVFAGILTSVLVFLTVSYQAIRIARVNPVKMLKSD